MSWREEDGGEGQLDMLLSFFVQITKQSSRAHVVLATSDFFLVEWLRGSRWRCWCLCLIRGSLFCAAYSFLPHPAAAVSCSCCAEGLTYPQVNVKVLGDLSEEEAERYMFGDESKGTGTGKAWKGLVTQFNLPPDQSAEVRDMWPRIYAVCGGNVGQLRSCLADVRVIGVLEGEPPEQRPACLPHQQQHHSSAAVQPAAACGSRPCCVPVCSCEERRALELLWCHVWPWTLNNAAPRQPTCVDHSAVHDRPEAHRHHPAPRGATA